MLMGRAVVVGMLLAAAFCLLVGLARAAGGSIAADEAAFVSAMRLYRLDLGRGLLHVDGRGAFFLERVIWSPDGAQIAYSLCPDDFRRSAARCVLEIAPADGGAPRRVQQGALPVLWSPDGGRLLYAQLPNYRLFLHDLTSGDRRALLVGVGTNPAWFAWGGDDVLVYAALREISGEINWQLYRLDLTVPLIFEPFAPEIGTANNVDPNWSPDGTRLAFISNGGVPLQDYPFIANADGSGVLRVAAQNAVEALAWSPDGTRLAFIHATPMRGGARLYVVEARENARARPLADGMARSAPVWSHDGRSIYAIGRDLRVYRVDAEAGSAVPIISQPVALPVTGGRILMLRPRG